MYALLIDNGSPSGPYFLSGTLDKIRFVSRSRDALCWTHDNAKTLADSIADALGWNIELVCIQ